MRCALGCLAALLAAACGSPAPETSKPSGPAGVQLAPPPPFKPGIPEAWRTDDAEVRITAVRSTEDAIEVDLTAPAEAKLPAGKGGFNLVLPDQGRFDVTVQTYAVGDDVIHDPSREDEPTTHSSGPPIPANSVRVTRKGTIRNWAIHRLELQQTFWRAALDAWKESDQELRATVRIALSQPEQAGSDEEGDDDAPVADAPAADPPEPTPGPPPKRKGHGIDRAIELLVANPDDLDRWYVHAPARPKNASFEPTDPGALAPEATTWARLRVEEGGLYRLSAEALTEAGTIAGPEELSNIRIFRESKAQPTHIVPQSGGERPQGVYFYGWPSTSEYDAGQVYWLAVVPGAEPVPIEPVSKSLMEGPYRPLRHVTRTARHDADEVKKVKTDNFLSIKELDWVEEELVDGQPVDFTLDLVQPLHGFAPEGSDAQLKLFPEGPPNTWQGTGIGLKQGDQTAATFEAGKDRNLLLRATILPKYLLGSPVSFSLDVDAPTSATAAAEDGMGLWLDWFEVRYPSRPILHRGRLVLNGDTVTTPGLYTYQTQKFLGGVAQRTLALALNAHSGEVRRLTRVGENTRLIVDKGWHSELWDLAEALEPRIEPLEWRQDILEPVAPNGEPVDYVIVTHHLFTDLLDPILELNRERGLTTRVVDIQWLYDLFSGGMLSPEAVQRYLGYMMHHWATPAPGYVLLVGDANSDFLNETRGDVPIYVPAYPYDYGSDTWASDHWLTCVSGDDDLPDYLIGRFSVNNVDDAREVIRKTVQYATEPIFGRWRGSMAYICDNHIKPSDQFRQTGERLRLEQSPAAFDAVRVHLDLLAMEDNWYIEKRHIDRIWEEEKDWVKVSAAATDAIKSTMNSGAAFLEYFGHGSPNLWADERIFFGGDTPNRDAQYLKSEGRYAFISNYTCNSGAIDYPMPPWNLCITEDLMRTPDGGAVAMFVPSGPGTTTEHEKVARQWRRALFGDNLRSVGAAVFQVRSRYALEGYRRNLLYMYILQGDPALDLQLTDRWYSLTARPEVIEPGFEALAISAEDVVPAEGLAQVRLETEAGTVLWDGAPFDYQGGRIQRDLTLDPGLTADLEPGGDLRVSLYGWNEQAGLDFVAAAQVRLVRPELQIADARATRLDERRVRFDVRVANVGPVASGPVRVEVRSLEAGRSPTLGEGTLTVGPDQSESLQMIEVVEPRAEPIYFEASVIPTHPPGQTEQPARLRRRIALLPDGGWNGIATPLSVRSKNAAGSSSRLQLRLLSSDLPSSSQTLVSRTAAGDIVTTHPLTYEPSDGYFVAQQNVGPRSRSQILGEDGWIELVRRGNSPPSEVLDKVAVRDLPLEEARLRIVPGAIHHTPQSPTDGQTVFIHFDVENVGTLPSPVCKPVLLDKSPDEHGKPLPSQTGLESPEVPPLGPGRRHSVTLRWDPIKNAGVQKVWIDLKPSGASQKPYRQEQIAPYSLYAKTKSSLKISRPLWIEQTPEDKLKDRVKLNVEITNQGETNAKNVEANFYYGEEKTDENKLDTILLEVVKANQSTVAQLVWEYDREKVLENGRFIKKPTVEVRLKGSKQRTAE